MVGATLAVSVVVATVAVGVGVGVGAQWQPAGGAAAVRRVRRLGASDAGDCCRGSVAHADGSGAPLAAAAGVAGAQQA